MRFQRLALTTGTLQQRLLNGMLATLMLTSGMVATITVAQAEGLYATPPAAMYDTGVEAYRAHNFSRAIAAFQQVLRTNASSVNAHYYLGLSLDNLNRVSEASAQYRFVVRNGIERDIVNYAQARLAALMTQPEPAVVMTPAVNQQTDVAMVASSHNMTQAVYHGGVTQIAVPLKASRNALMLDATLKQGNNATVGSFILDTGATYTSISQDLADALHLDLSHCEKVKITTANGRIDVPKIVIETLSINGLEAHNIEATVIPVRAGSSFAGLLGLSFIRQFVLTIDPDANQLVFRRN